MSKYHHKTSGLFKQEFQGIRMVALTSECYYVEDDKSKAKFSCKGVSTKQNPMSWERYLEALNGSMDKAQNTGFRLLDSRILMYTQSRLGLSAYYDKQVVLPIEIQYSTPKVSFVTDFDESCNLLNTEFSYVYLHFFGCFLAFFNLSEV